ncbi:MAG: Gfo/Idh/MocA family oxidoreductase, partial [bacterium]|nr:Gfo/Idh/MocA family oxidoreductase [bacterium]
MRRREFMKRTLTGAAGVLGFPAIVPASALGAGATPPSERITMGCVGVGRMGGNNMRGFLKNHGVRVVAVCDVKEAVRQKAKGLVDAQYGDKACAVHNDFRELLARKDIDAVMIATGERWHPLVGIEAASQGKHMYYEKPLALTVEAAEAIREAIRRSGAIFQFGTQQRSGQRFRLACEIVRNGLIGELKHVNVWSPGSRSGGSPEVARPP